MKTNKIELTKTVQFSIGQLSALYRLHPFQKCRRVCRCLILIATAGLGVWPTISFAQIQNKVDFNLPPQDLTTSLIQLGKQADLTLIITDASSRNSTTTEIVGLMTPIEAIEVLLKKTDLVYEIISPKIVSIHKARETQEEELPQLADPGKLEYTNVLGFKLTGSNIRRLNVEDGTAPLDVISETEIRRSGSETLADFIRFIPAVSGNSTSTAVSNGGDGTTKVTLRGLPANNTLVLINGQRVAFDGLAGDSVDLNTIAPSAIERLEILKDGASAIYGSDAIAGVINIAMKEAFDGANVAQYLGQSSRGDLHTQSTSLLFGDIGKSYSGIVAINYYKQDGLFSRDRELSKSADNRAQGGADQRSSATTFTRLTDSNRVGLVLDTDEDGNALPGTSPEHYRVATTEDLFDYRSQTSSISPSERSGLYASLTNSLNDSLQLRNFTLASNTDATITLASAPLFTTFGEEPIIVSADNPYNPFGLDIYDVRRRIIELPARTQRNESRNYYLNSVLEYFRQGFEWSTGIYWNQTTAKETLSHLADGTNLALALGPEAGCLAFEGCVPVNIFGPPGSITPEQLEFVATDRKAKGKSKIYGLNTSISGILPTSDNNFVSYAAGLDWRKESSEFTPDELQRTNLVGGVFQSSTSGDREVLEVFGELLIPLLRDLRFAEVVDLELASRYTKSSDYGENISPKMGVKYRFTQGLTLRSTLSSGFRAPSIKELYTSGSRSFASLEDPCSSTENVGILEGCTQLSDESLNQFLTEYSGFSELEPEESTSFTFGFYLNPSLLPELTISADAFSIRQKNVIDANAQTIVDENARSGAFSELVTRDSNGNITFIQAPFINIGERHVQGIDFSAAYDFREPNVSFNLSASYLHRYINKLNEFTEEEDLAGRFEDAAELGNGSLPHWKVNFGWILKKPLWEWNYNINYVSPLDETFLYDGFQHRSIGQWITHNSQLQLTPGPNKKISYVFGVDNLFDQAPPFAASAFNDDHDSRTHNIKGRFLYVKLSFNI